MVFGNRIVGGCGGKSEGKSFGFPPPQRSGKQFGGDPEATEINFILLHPKNNVIGSRQKLF